jgi:hypothetical protein
MIRYCHAVCQRDCFVAGRVTKEHEMSYQTRIRSIRLFAACALFVCGGVLAHAAEAEKRALIGKAVFLTGEVTLEKQGEAAQALRQGDAITEGVTIRAGADGHVYFRMNDNGFLAVRPNSQLRIEAYVWNPDDPSRNRIVLHTDKGVVRSKTGAAGSAARERFRMNTPVAAIGVRGTDFTVSSQQDVIHVAVQQGTVSVSPYGNGCAVDALGPCTGELARDISDSALNMVLEVRGAQSPALVPAPKAPDFQDINRIKPDEHVSVEETPLLEDNGKRVEINADQQQKLEDSPMQSLPGDIAQDYPKSPQVNRPDAVWWGRWSAFVRPGEARSLTDDRPAKNELFNYAKWQFVRVPSRTDEKGVYGFYRLKDDTLPASLTGEARFVLTEAEVSVRDIYSHELQRPAEVLQKDATLYIDFGALSFSTHIDVKDGENRYPINATGTIDRNLGTFIDNGQGDSTVRGVIADQGAQAGYVFSRPLEGTRDELLGVTIWRQ